MKIVYVYADNAQEWNCSEWRCAIPARAIQRNGRHSAEMLSIHDFAHNSPRAQELCSPADVIVVERNLFGPVLSSIQHWKARDKVVIANFDDAYNLMHPTNVAYPFWGQGLMKHADGTQEKMEPAPLTQFKWGLRLVHGGTVPSRRLADDWQTFTDMHYVPNYIDLEKYTNVSRDEHDGIVIGWGGSLSHLQSFTDSGVLSALKRVVKARPQVKIMVCGGDKRIFDQLNIPENQKIYQPWVPFTNWAQVLAKFDIGLAPLLGAYDERRSWIKVLEYMVMRIPWVASEGPSYYDLRPYGWLVNNTPASWERVLLDMVDQVEDYRAEAADEPYLYALAQSADENVGKIIETYTRIGQRAGLLNTGLSASFDTRQYAGV